MFAATRTKTSSLLLAPLVRFSAPAAAAPAVPAALVKKLRDATGSPLMECKKALGAVLADGPLEDSPAMKAAIEWLRKKGTTLAASKSSRAAKEGVVVFAVSKDKKTGALLEVNCETDFVSRNSTFLAYAVRSAIAAVDNAPALSAAAAPDAAFNFKAADVEALKVCALPAGPAAMPASAAAADNNVAQELVDVVSTLRENIKVRRGAFVSLANSGNANGFVASYVHNELPIPVELQPYLDTVAGQGYEVRFGGSAAVAAVATSATEAPDAELSDLARKVAMQAVAGRPEYLARANVPAELLAKEREIIMAAPETAGKKADIVDRLVEGKLGKFYEAAVLVDQVFLITNDTKRPKVGELLARNAAKPVVAQLARFTRGEPVAGEEEEPAPEASA